MLEEAKKYIPGGVHSPVRSFKTLKEDPFFTLKSQGPYLYSENKRYIDFCLGFGTLIFGHQPSFLKEEALKVLNDGWLYGTCEPYSLALAQFIIKKISFIEKIRFMNSGTEAVMTALRLARAYSKKNNIIKFQGCFHGHVDSMLIQSGSALQSTSKGLSNFNLNSTIVSPYFDLDYIESLLKKHEPGALIIEPLPANQGLIVLSDKFLEDLLQLCLKYEVVSIFDEVISGFRCDFEGRSKNLKLKPDLITYGKILGGGFPIGAVGGKSDILNLLAPEGPVYQAGTFSANPMSMRLGLKTLQALTPEYYLALENLTKKITYLLQKKIHHPLISYKSLFWFKMSPEEYKELFSWLLSQGIYFAPHVAEVQFSSLAHEEILPELQSIFS